MRYEGVTSPQKSESICILLIWDLTRRILSRQLSSICRWTCTYNNVRPLNSGLHPWRKQSEVRGGFKVTRREIGRLVPPTASLSQRQVSMPRDLRSTIPVHAIVRMRNGKLCNTAQLISPSDAQNVQHTSDKCLLCPRAHEQPAVLAVRRLYVAHHPKQGEQEVPPAHTAHPSSQHAMQRRHPYC